MYCVHTTTFVGVLKAYERSKERSRVYFIYLFSLESFKGDSTKKAPIYVMVSI